MRTYHTHLPFLAIIVVFINFSRGADVFVNSTSTIQSSVTVTSTTSLSSAIPSTATTSLFTSSDATDTTSSTSLSSSSDAPVTTSSSSLSSSSDAPATTSSTSLSSSSDAPATTLSTSLSTSSVATSDQSLSLNTTQASSTSTAISTSASNSTGGATTTIPSGSTSTISGASSSATVTLAPAVHWDTDPNDLSHVSPQPSASFYYAEQPGAMDPNVGGQFAVVTSNFTYPTVVLEHSGHIDNITCGPSPTDPSTIQLAISFSTAEGYQSAKTNWNLHADLVLITYISGCGVTAADQRAFWKVSSLNFDDKGQNIVVLAKEIQLQDSIKEMDIEWGTYQPPQTENSTFITVASNNESTTVTCGAPDSSTLDGFPAAPCGPNFDHTLDDIIGYIDATSTESSTVSKRCHWYQFACLAKEAYDAAQKLLHKYDPNWDPSVSKQVQFNLGPSSSQLVPTTFGQAYKLFQYQKDSQNYVAAYCVNCGVQGQVTLSGKASIALLEGLRSAQVGIAGNLHAGLYLGIDAQGEVGPPAYNQALWSVGIPGLSVPGVYSIGPMVAVGADLTLGVQAGGQLYLGAAMDWPSFSVQMDLLHGHNSQFSGLTPTVSSKFLASGKITASATLGFPISVGIGLDIPVINFHKALELVDKPGLTSSVTFDGSSSTSSLTSSCDNGISTNTIFTNNVYISVFDITNWNIWNYKSNPIYHSCYHIFMRGLAEIQEAAQAAKSKRSYGRREIANATTGPNGTFVPPPGGVDESNTTSIVAPDGTSYTSIVDIDLAYQLSAGGDGNLYLDTNGGPDGSLFAISENVSLADSTGRVFHYYKDVMSRYGVSRFRLSDVSSIPTTAEVAALILLGDVDGRYNGRPVFGVIDPDGTVTYPVVCSIVGQTSKIFLVKDVDDGTQTLLRSDLRNTITGGEVSKCAFIPLTPGISVIASR